MIIIRNAVIYILAALVLMAPIAGAKAQSATFVSVIPDLPLMDGLQEELDEGVVFETASGRIAEALAQGRLVPQDVTNYYANALPQLGWHLISDIKYQREGEVLSIEIHSDDQDSQLLIVQFKLSPVAQ